MGKKTHAHLLFKCQLYSLVLPQCIISHILSWPLYRDLHHFQQTASGLSQFSSDLVRGVNPRERREKRGRASPVSRPPSRTWSFACLAHFARRTKKKERLLVVYIISASFESRSLPANLPRIPLQPQMLLFLNSVVLRQWIVTVDNKTAIIAFENKLLLEARTQCQKLASSLCTYNNQRVQIQGSKIE